MPVAAGNRAVYLVAQTDPAQWWPGTFQGKPEGQITWRSSIIGQSLQFPPYVWRFDFRFRSIVCPPLTARSSGVGPCVSPSPFINSRPKAWAGEIYTWSLGTRAGGPGARCSRFLSVGQPVSCGGADRARRHPPVAAPLPDAGAPRIRPHSTGTPFATRPSKPHSAPSWRVQPEIMHFQHVQGVSARLIALAAAGRRHDPARLLVLLREQPVGAPGSIDLCRAEVGLELRGLRHPRQPALAARDAAVGRAAVRLSQRLPPPAGSRDRLLHRSQPFSSGAVRPPGLPGRAHPGAGKRPGSRPAQRDARRRTATPRARPHFGFLGSLAGRRASMCWWKPSIASPRRPRP